MANTCYDPKAKELVHKNHQDTGRTQPETQNGRTINWKVYTCQCGQHDMLVRP